MECGRAAGDVPTTTSVDRNALAPLEVAAFVVEAHGKAMRSRRRAA